MSKVTIEDILKKKKLVSTEKIKPFSSDFFNGEIDIDDVDITTIMNILEKADENDPLRADDELIYTCCPLFRNKELQEQLEVKDPIDTVRAVYGRNIAEPSKLVKHILSYYGMDFNSEVQKVKKQ